jgi:hypothetical protein
MTCRKARRAGYEWPLISVVHPDHGSYEFAIHGVRAATGAVTLMAFHGVPAGDPAKMNDVVFDTARGTRSQVIRLCEDDVSDELAVFLAAQAHAKPLTGVLIVPGAEWGITDRPAGRLN